MCACIIRINLNCFFIKTYCFLIFIKFIKLLDDTKVKAFGEPGDLLDANLHDAMLTKIDKKMKDGQILEVFERNDVNGHIVWDK